MNLSHPTSLSATLDIAEEAFFYQKPLSTPMRDEIALMIINRQRRTGTNAGFFLPFAAEMETVPRLFTGEQIYTSLARNHILLLQATRLLKLLNLDDPAAKKAIQVAYHCMETMCYTKFCSKGECKTLTIAFLRWLAVDCDVEAQSRINSLLSALAGYRDGKGTWSGFPIYYTLLMLTELDDPQATLELQYSTRFSEIQRARNWSADPISNRRQAILARALARS